MTNNLKLLMLDIETAPNKAYVWGLWDQNIAINQIVEPGYTLCWAAKWYGQKKMMFEAVFSKGSENQADVMKTDSIQKAASLRMLKRIHELISEADAVVHYNGTRFDMPTLNWEFLEYGLDPPAPYKQIDLYYTAKKQFRLPSYKMDYVAQHLNLGAKLPHKGMDLWKGCMAGDVASWKTMEKYNKQDVKLLEKIYVEFLPWIQNHPNQGLYLKSDRPVCTNCGSTHVTSKGSRTVKTST